MISVTKEYRKNLEKEVKAGYIRCQTNEDKTLKIYTYSTKTEMEEHWNEYTLKSRGLVLDDNNRVVINCVPKFFNSGQNGAEDVKLDDPKTEISMKNDGYMIQIKKDHEYGLVVTSKGSFSSDMASKAKELIDEEALEPDYTYICELCCNFPGDEAIIVKRWEGDPKLTVWAVMNPENEEIPLNDAILPTCLEPTVRFNYLDALEYLNRNDVEGVVGKNGDKRVKFKTEHFMAMHRLISDIRKVRVWEILSKGYDLDSINIPDEFMEQMKKWKEEMLDQIARWNSSLIQYENQYGSKTDKDLALNQDIPQFFKVMMFNRRKNKPYMNIMWKRLREQIKEEM